MPIYGIYPRTKLTESVIVVAESTKVINECKKNVDLVRVYNEGANYYVSGKEIEQYMEAAEIGDINKAVQNIKEANNIDSLVVNLDECSDIFKELIAEETDIVTEASAEDNATNVKKVMKWYSKFVSKSRSKTEKKEEIEERIDILKDCVKQMKRAKITGQSKTKYMLKAFIPYNRIYRLIKRQDTYSGLTLLGDILSNCIVPGVDGVTDLGIRYASWENMLDKAIDETEEAIKYLEGELKKLK